MRISDWSSDVCSSDLTRRMMSASDYGIVGDGIADDTAALQAALDAITTDGGTFVDIPPGVYRISATLRLTFTHDSAAHVGLLSHGATLKSRSEEHKSELQSLMRKSYAVFCLTKKK